MRTKLLSVFFIALPLLSNAQTVNSVSISEGSIDLSTSTVVGEITINPATAGKVIVHFDGVCIADVGDRIILAASNTTNWGVNDGGVGIEVNNTDINRRSFSHTRVYDVVPGSQTFYAVADNAIETDGSGIASIYGNLTVEYIPNGISTLVGFTGVAEPSIDLTSETTVGSVTINPATTGRVIVRFDGFCIASPGDMIVLAASNTASWGVDDGNVGVEIDNSDVTQAQFSHTRVYDVVAGSQTFYAIAHNYVETAGTGIASIYGALTVEFIPDGYSLVGFDGIIATNQDLTNATTVGQVTINPATAGKAIVNFNGKVVSSVGDRIVLAASNTTAWGSNDGNVSVEAENADLDRNSFSHTRVYDIAAGSHTFYAVAQNYVETDGTGIASIYGSLTVTFISNGTAGIEETSGNEIIIYPNPATYLISIQGIEVGAIVTIYAMSGQKVLELKADSEITQINLSDLEAGIYTAEIITDGKITSQKIIKN
jgi:predicted Rdx family selenoprotein